MSRVEVMSRVKARSLQWREAAEFVVDKSLPVQSENRKEVQKRRKSHSS